ncbi:MAG: cytochrome c, partial [Oleiagrimonas sp.]|nr:cytochrome c [Oleiagrimonas sp.]
MNRPAGIAGILVAAIIGIPFALTAHGGRVSADVGSSTRTPSLQQVEKGRYLVRAGDCVACHSSRGGQPFAGNRPIPTPFGMLYSSNITPDKATGIGTWTEEDFWTALHEGKGRHGRLLYPAFPYTAYTHVKRADADAM